MNVQHRNLHVVQINGWTMHLNVRIPEHSLLKYCFLRNFLEKHNGDELITR
jgi:hypothetical protein